MMLHESFCFRQNVLCRLGCGQVFKKNSPEWAQHWHCTRSTTTDVTVDGSDVDGAWGNSRASAVKHADVSHTARACPSCAGAFRAASLPQLAHHRTSMCPGKLIICQFCHLLVPQGSPDDEDDDDGNRHSAHDRVGDSDVGSGGDASIRASFLLSDLTPHEYRDGARTTECHLCGRFVRLRDMATHLRHHDYERRRRRRPRVCRNANCSSIVDRGGIAGAGGIGAGVAAEAGGAANGSGGGGTFGLCSVCFGPLYVSMYDPDGRALRRRVERRYLTQLLSGCGKAWCRNAFCKTGHAKASASLALLPPPPPPPSSTSSTQLSPKPPNPVPHSAAPPLELPRNTKDAAALVKPFVDAFTTYNATTSFTSATISTPTSSSLHFCVDERRQNLRALAENMVMMMAPATAGDHPNVDAAHLPSLPSSPYALSGSRPSPESSTRPQYALEWCLCALEAVTTSSSSSSSSSTAKHDADDADDDIDADADGVKGKESGGSSGVGTDGGGDKAKEAAGRAEAAVIERAWRWLQDWAPTLQEEQETQR
jgi:hypothetical protein